MFSVYNALLSRNNLVHDVGYMEYGSTSSMELIILVDEMVAMCRRFMDGIPVTEKTLALEAIERASLKGGFMDDDHTLENWRHAQYQPKRLDRMQYDRWVDRGGLGLSDRLNQEAQEIMAGHVSEKKPVEVIENINRILEKPR
jgi:trimethylamine--corrinoid protein Co-methyltransferase